MGFTNFADFAKFVLTKLSENDFKLLQFFVGIILILPFATADCERSFSPVNRIKSSERSKLRNILMDLLSLYDINPQEKATLDIEKLAYDVLHNVWKYEKKNLLDPKLRQNDDQMYSMIFVWSVLHSVVECWRFDKSWLEMFQQYAQCTAYFFQKYISKNSRPVGRDFLPKITGRRISRPRA